MYSRAESSGKRSRGGLGSGREWLWYQSAPGGGAIVRAVGNAHLMMTHRWRLFNSLWIPGTIFRNTTLANWVGLSLIYIKIIANRNWLDLWDPLLEMVSIVSNTTWCLGLGMGDGSEAGKPSDALDSFCRAKQVISYIHTVSPNATAFIATEMLFLYLCPYLYLTCN